VPTDVQIPQPPQVIQPEKSQVVDIQDEIFTNLSSTQDESLPKMTEQMTTEQRTAEQRTIEAYTQMTPRTTDQAVSYS
jgi:hypothetical protein